MQTKTKKKTTRVKKITRPRGGHVIKTRIRAGIKLDG
jgi:hypothetical protein